MYLDEIIEKLMDLDEHTVPCELGIPCPITIRNQMVLIAIEEVA